MNILNQRGGALPKKNKKAKVEHEHRYAELQITTEQLVSAGSPVLLLSMCLCSRLSSVLGLFQDVNERMSRKRHTAQRRHEQVGGGLAPLPSITLGGTQMYRVCFSVVLCTLTFFFPSACLCNHGGRREVRIIILPTFPDFPVAGGGGTILTVGHLDAVFGAYLTLSALIIRKKKVSYVV